MPHMSAHFLAYALPKLQREKGFNCSPLGPGESDDAAALVTACARTMGTTENDVLVALGRYIIEKEGHESVLPPEDCNILQALLSLPEIFSFTLVRSLAPLVMGSALQLCERRCSSVSAQLLETPAVSLQPPLTDEPIPLVRLFFSLPDPAPQPQLPAGGFEQRLLALCPFILLLGADMKVIGAGRSLLAAAPALQPGSDAAALLRAAQPMRLPLERFALLRFFADTTVHLSLALAGGGTQQHLRGMFHDLPGTGLVFNGQLVPCPAAGRGLGEGTTATNPGRVSSSSATLMAEHDGPPQRAARKSSLGGKLRPQPAAALVRAPRNDILPEEQCDGDWSFWWEVIQKLPATVAARLDEIAAAVDAKDVKLLQTAAHALMGVAESCCAKALAEACYELQTFAVGLAPSPPAQPRGQRPSESGEINAAAMEPAREHYCPSVRSRAEVVVRHIAFLEALPPAQRVALLAAAEGFPEMISDARRPLGERLQRLSLDEPPPVRSSLDGRPGLRRELPELPQLELAHNTRAPSEMWFTSEITAEATAEATAALAEEEAAGVAVPWPGTSSRVKGPVGAADAEGPPLWSRSSLDVQAAGRQEGLSAGTGQLPRFQETIQKNAQPSKRTSERRSLDIEAVKRASAEEFSDMSFHASSRRRSSVERGASDDYTGEADDCVQPMMDWVMRPEGGVAQAHQAPARAMSYSGVVDSHSSRLSSTLSPHADGEFESRSSRIYLRQYSKGIHQLAERLLRSSSSGGFQMKQSAEQQEPSIMVVDDNPMVVAILQRALAAAGFKVIAASSAEKALEHLIRPNSVLPNVLILDVFYEPMQMTGLQMCAKLREKGISAIMLPVIMMSSHCTKDLIDRAYDAGANDWMAKPVNTHEVAARVREQMRMLRSVGAEAEARLLQHFLPPAVIRKLKSGLKMPFTEHVPEVTILFADIVGFTTMCSTVDAQSVVGTLHNLFSAFDEATGPLGVYKVDTVGDAYICSTGCALTEVEPLEAPASRMLRFAERMLRITDSMDVEGWPKQLQIRIGIHTGPAIATALGQKSFKFTFIGDTVNTASRMESHGSPSCVHCSEQCVAALLREGANPDDFLPQEASTIKGKGLMQTYYWKVGAWKELASAHP